MIDKYQLDKLPERFRSYNLGIFDIDVSSHYFNELMCGAISDNDIIVNPGFSEERKEEARKSLPENLQALVTYREFLAEEVERYNENASEYGNLTIRLEDVIGILMTSGSNGERLNKITQELKAMGIEGEKLDYDRLRNLCLEATCLIYGEEDRDKYKLRLGISD
ncbi:hypothetical protein GOV06_03080 [Candidatus Woesearchaeota archaeon]|nr:hypothetical protein [Candidatus Woesearchaeota archaeon]